MSTTLKATIVKSGLVLALLGGSFAVSAKQVSFEEYVDYTVEGNTRQVQDQLFSEVEHNLYENAVASLRSYAQVPEPRSLPVVNITEFRQAEEDEE